MTSDQYVHLYKGDPTRRSPDSLSKRCVVSEVYALTMLGILPISFKFDMKSKNRHRFNVDHIKEEILSRQNILRGKNLREIYR